MKEFRTRSRLTAFLYQVMRDHLPPGTVEKIVLEDEAKIGPEDEIVLTNGHLAAYADEVARRLT